MSTEHGHCLELIVHNNNLPVNREGSPKRLVFGNPYLEINTTFYLFI